MLYQSCSAVMSRHRMSCSQMLHGFTLLCDSRALLPLQLCTKTVLAPTTSTRLSCLARPSSVLSHVAWLQADSTAHFMQVGLKTQYQGSQGQIMFFLGNKHAAPLERIIFVVPPQPQFQFQLAPVPQRLEAKQQVQVSPCCCP